MRALQLLGEAGPGALSLGGPFLAPRHPGSSTLPSCSAVQFLGSALRGPLSPAEDQDQAGCDLGAGISRRQFSRPWSGELPTGPPVKSRHLELHQSLASVNPRSIACALSRAAGPTGGGAECWTCHGSSGPLDQDLAPSTWQPWLWGALPKPGQPVSATDVEAWSGAAMREAGRKPAVRRPSSTREGRRCPASPTGRL